MKILMISSVCGIRSTGRICTDLAVALEGQGHKVKIAYGREAVPEQYKRFSVRIGNETAVKCHGALARLYDADGRGSVLATKKFVSWVKEYDPDVVHLHNIHGYYINTKILFDYLIKSNKRVIWTLHDMWSFTGHGCTCDMYNCEKWRMGCEKCPAYRDYPGSLIDKSEENYRRKQKLFSSVNNLTLVTPSRWLAGLVSESYLKDKKIKVIPNGIDLKQFYPLKSDFKKANNIEGKIFLMGCSTWWDTGKGLEDFYKLAEKLDDRYAIVLVGLDKGQIGELPKRIIGIERTNSVKELAEIYSAADIFLNLTYRDNYPTVNLEALACGTPVITYRTGGSAECLNEENVRAFNKGDVDSIVDFLNNEYSADSFRVVPQPSLNKELAAEQYQNLLGGKGYFQIKNQYGLLGKIVVLGVAAYWGERKGLSDFIQLAKDLTNEYAIIMVGVDNEIKRQLPDNIISIERTNSQEELRELYAIADVFVNPTIQDNFPTVNLEAVACGTPVVTYDTGGSSESAYTPSCVVMKNDYRALKNCLLSRRYENALNLSSRWLIDKKTMAERYEELYLMQQE